MAVEVYDVSRKHMIGHLHGWVLKPGARRRSIAVSDTTTFSVPDPDPVSVVTLNRSISLIQVARHFRLEKALWELDPDAAARLVATRVPEGAREGTWPSPHGTVKTWCWEALAVPDAEASELLFDLDAFDPIHEPACQAWHIEEAWWRSRSQRGELQPYQRHLTRIWSEFSLIPLRRATGLGGMMV